MTKYVQRCMAVGLMLGCVALLLFAARGDADFLSDRSDGKASERVRAQSESSMPVNIAAPENTDMASDGEELEEMPEAPYAKIYYKFLQEYLSDTAAEYGYGFGRFGLALIDGDDIPELLIVGASNRISVFTCYEEQVVELGELGGSYGELLYCERAYSPL